MKWLGEVENVGESLFTALLVDPDGKRYRATLPQTMALYTHWWLVRPGDRFVLDLASRPQEVKFLKPTPQRETVRNPYAPLEQELPTVYLEQLSTIVPRQS